MVTKVEAAGIAGAAGIPTLLTAAADVAAALSGADVGTVFAPGGGTRASRCSGWRTPRRRGAGCCSTTVPSRR